VADNLADGLEQIAAPHPKEELMTARTTAKNTGPRRPRKPAVKMIPEQPPVQTEIRLNGAIRFANMLYNVTLEQADDGQVTLVGTLNPTLIEAPEPKFMHFGDDPRDGTEIIQQVHSGRRDT
jgi:hypothetical protein